MKYLPIQINGEWCLKSENPHEYNISLYEDFNCYEFEKEAIATAKPIINHDGREWYDSKELDEVWQFKRRDNNNGWTNSPMADFSFKDFNGFKEYWSYGEVTAETRQAWKYIGEKPVEKATGIEFESEAMDYYRSYWKSDNNSVSYEPVVEAYCFAAGKERTRIIGIIESLKIKSVMLSIGDVEYNKDIDTLIQQINNNGNEKH